jgi:mRNA interferase MazF
MKRGDVFLADLEPVRGSEANKARPVILIGNQASLGAAARLHRGVVTVVPCTSNVSMHGAMHALLRPTKLNGLSVLSKAQTEHVRSIDVGRLVRRLGHLGAADLAAVEQALAYHLDL